MRLREIGFIGVLYLAILLCGLCGLALGADAVADANSLSQYGITWYFDKTLTTDGAGDTYQYGLYVNGDAWVLNEGAGVVIERITPESVEYQYHFTVSGSITGTFQADETVAQATSGATGTFRVLTQQGGVVIEQTIGGADFDTTHTITGDTSGASFTPSAIVNRIANGAELNPNGYKSWNSGSTVVPVNNYNGYDSEMHKWAGVDYRHHPEYTYYTESMNYARANDAPLSKANPRTITSGSLVSSYANPHPVVKCEMVNTYAVLTIVETAPDPNDFRPAYALESKVSNYNYDTDVLWDELRDLPLVSGYESWATYAGWFERPWIVYMTIEGNQTLHGTLNSPYYSRLNGERTGEVVLRLNCYDTQENKRQTLINFLQCGIDHYGVMATGKKMPFGQWPPIEGQNMGKKLPIVFAGKMFNDPNMLNIGTWWTSSDYVEGTDSNWYMCIKSHVSSSSTRPVTGGSYATYWQLISAVPGQTEETPPAAVRKTWEDATQYCTGHVFQEDLSYGYIGGDEIDRYVFGVNEGYPDAVQGSDSNWYRCIADHTAAAANYPITGESWDTYWEYTEDVPSAYQDTWVSGNTYDSGWEYQIVTQYDANDLGTAEWITRWYGPYANRATGDAGWTEAAYRGINIAGLAATALAVMITDCNSVWDREPFLDFMDRWWYLTEPYGESIQNQTVDTFTWNMWDAYRSDLDAEDYSGGEGGGGGGVPETGETYYVDRGVSGGAGDGSSLANAYSGLAAAVAARAKDLSATGGVKFRCYDTSGTTPETSGITVSGFSNWSESDPIVIEVCDEDYKIAVADTEQRLLYLANPTWVYGYEGNVLVQLTSANGSESGGVVYCEGAGTSRLANFAIQGPDNDDYYCRGVTVHSADTTVELNNMIIYDLGQNALSRAVGPGNVACSIYAYNCRVDNCYQGFRAYGTGSNIYCVNCITTETNAGFSEDGGNVDTTSCTSSDTTAETFDTGETCTNSVTPTETGFYRLAEADTAWDQAGTDLTEDDHWFLDAVDIDGKGRSAAYFGIGPSKYTDETAAAALCDAPVWVTEPYFVTNASIFMEATPDPNATEYLFARFVPSGDEEIVSSSGWTADPNWLLETVSLVDEMDFRYKARNSDEVESDWTDPLYLQWAPTEIVRYVDATSGNDSTGDGSSGTPWKTMSKAESEIDDYGENSDGDLTVMGETYPHGCYVTLHVSNGTDTTAVTWSGNTTDATRYISVEGDGTYTLGADAVSLQVQIGGIRFDDITIDSSSVTASYRYPCYLSSITSSVPIHLTNCVFIGAANASYVQRGVTLNSADAVVILNNCLFYNIGSASGSYGIYNQTGSIYAYNLSIINCRYCFYAGNEAGSVTTMKNCIADGNIITFVKEAAATLLLWNCTSSDDRAATYDQGSACQINVTPTFTGLYNLAAIDTNWINAGLDLSDDSYWVLDSVDHEGTRRPYGKWDIGWDEYTPPSPGVGIGQGIGMGIGK